MQIADLYNLIDLAECKEGTSLRGFFRAYFHLSTRQLTNFTGTFEEVMLTHAVHSARKKGVVEEFELDCETYSHRLMNICQSLNGKMEGDD